ncbi:nucleotidyltransferase domain-containing protein [Pedobacter sp. SD-b]|uniref:Nucleotidyltransferase domain-containing protein n=1 Tax=Pedobacter segetis TaxID=2793069 RepID=A0ABS1BNV6_9SPHI|nr:nucleotidyltransferase domain-containing protein [Pedobacter segetis]MBK0383996.1 nucleotidyltransferase domain-containing protein [Pedobacter segetis]
MKIEIIEKIKLLKPQLKKDFNVDEIALFGSYSRNEETEKSDLDIIVKLHKPLGLKFLTLLYFLEHNLKQKVDLVTEQALRKNMKSQILSEAIFI